MGEWNDWIGKTQEQSDILTPALLTRFRATIDSSEQEDVAPQGIHWCLCLPDTATAELGEDGHPRKGGWLPPITLPRRMWASSSVAFLQPIKVRDNITRRSAIANITEKSGNSGPLIFVDIDHDTLANTALAVRERQTLVYRAAVTTASMARPDEEEPDLSDWDWHRSLVPSETLLFRYSALTFNNHRIHYDRPYASEIEGYRGLVVQGPLTATLLLDLAGRMIGTNRLNHFSFRGQSPAFAGDRLWLVAKRTDHTLTLVALGNDGRTVMMAEAEY
jgi:3-methylfumaryl-CoA hydratase